MKLLRKAVVLLLLLFIAFEVSAFTVKIGTIAPPGTPWDAVLHELARKWKEVTDGAVELKIFAGGIAGDEADMLRKVRLGDRLQGAAISGTALNRISSELLVMNLPLLFEGYGELQYVVDQMSETFEGLIRDKGFELVAWTAIGWVQFFGKQPIVTPDDLRKLKLAVTAEDEEILYSWRTAGFNALPLHPTEILTGLQMGMAEAFHAPPILAAVYQWFGLCPNMSSIKIAPLVAGLIINERTWRRIPSRYRDDLIEVSKSTIRDLYDRTQQIEEEAIEVMLANGLVINEVPDDAMEEWRELMEQGYDLLVGPSISQEVFEQTLSFRDEYRATHESE